MATAFSISRHTGTICFGEVGLLAGNLQKDEVAPTVRDLIEGAWDRGNGYEWLNLRELTFGGQPALLSLCFHEGLLKQAAWSVRLPNASPEDGWPTREAIDSEVAFVRRTWQRGWALALAR